MGLTVSVLKPKTLRCEAPGQGKLEWIAGGGERPGPGVLAEKSTLALHTGGPPARLEVAGNILTQVHLMGGLLNP